MSDRLQSPETPTRVDLGDVRGYESVISTLSAFIEQSAENEGAACPNIVVISGAPGTGKTFIVRALAGEYDWNLLSVTPSDLFGPEATDPAVEPLFAAARDYQPCLVLVDEIDALATGTAGASVDEMLLAPSRDSRDEAVLLVATTNTVAPLESLLAVDTVAHVELGLPSADERALILRSRLDDYPVASGIDWSSLAGETDGYTPRDLDRVARTAARKALQDSHHADAEVDISGVHLREAIVDTDPEITDLGRWY